MKRRFGIALLAVLALLAFGSATATAKQPRLDARAWALIDARSGDVLASHAAARHLSIASTTKLMTAYVAMKELPLDRIVRAAPYYAIYGESLLGLRPGQRVSVRDLLYGLILQSGNDAAYDLALAAAGSEPRFVRQMNRRAAALGLADTHYANPIGLDEAGNHSSARDLTTLAQRLLRIPVFAKIADSRRAVLRSLRPPRRIGTRNDLLLRESWATGVKTGHTFGAGYVLVGSGRRKGAELISAVLGAPTETDRDLESLRLLDYGFSLYRKRVPVRAGEELASPSIAFTGGRAAVARRPHSRRRPPPWRAVARRGAGTGRGRRPDSPRRRARPGDGLRRWLRMASAPLRAGRAVPEASPLDRARSFVTGHPIFIGLGAFSAILVGIAILRRRRRRGTEGEETIRESREQRRAERQRRREEDMVR